MISFWHLVSPYLAKNHIGYMTLLILLLVFVLLPFPATSQWYSPINVFNSSLLHFYLKEELCMFDIIIDSKWSYLIDAPIIIGNAHSWNALRCPTPSRIQPLNRDPTKAPPKHVLTTKPVLTEEKHQIRLWYVFS